MSYNIDEQAIIDRAINELPDVEFFDGKLALIYVNDFYGETKIIAENRFSEIHLPNGELMILDRKGNSYIYSVVFQKIKEKGKWVWDLVGYHKRSCISLNNS